MKVSSQSNLKHTTSLDVHTGEPVQLRNIQVVARAVAGGPPSSKENLERINIASPSILALGWCKK